MDLLVPLGKKMLSMEVNQSKILQKIGTINASMDKITTEVDDTGMKLKNE